MDSCFDLIGSLLAGGYLGFHRGKPVPFGNRAPSWIFEARAPGYERASTPLPAPLPSRSLCQLSTRSRPGRANSRWRPHCEFRFFWTIQPPAWVSSARRSKLYEVISWLTDIHILTEMVMTSDGTRIQILANWPMSHAKRVTRSDKGQ